MVGELVERAVAAGMLEGEVLGLDVWISRPAAASTWSSRSASAAGDRRCAPSYRTPEQLRDGGRIPTVDDASGGDDGGDRRHAEAPQLGAR